MIENDNLKYTCLFGGGAIRGTAHVGVLKALVELGIKPDIYAGSSVGSIVAALISVGYSYDELKDIFMGVNFELFRDISFGFKKKFALSKGEVFLEWIRELIEKKFYGENYVKDQNNPVRFCDISQKLVIITTDLNTFKCCEFSSFETPEFEIAMAVRISCCMPGLMRAVTLDNKLLVDGDLMKGRPMWSLSKNIQESNSRILEIRLEGAFTGTDLNPIEYVNGMYSCITCSETDFVKSVYQNCDKFDYLVINTGDVVVVDFNYPKEKRDEILQNGYSQTINYFKSVLPKKKQYLMSLYRQLFFGVLRFYKDFKRKKYIQAKLSISELFITLSQVNPVIDECLYKDICMLQKLFYSNVKTGLLGTVKCDNIQSVEQSASFILDSLTAKIDSLNDFITKFSV